MRLKRVLQLFCEGRQRGTDLELFRNLALTSLACCLPSQKVLGPRTSSDFNATTNCTQSRDDACCRTLLKALQTCSQSDFSDGVKEGEQDIAASSERGAGLKKDASCQLPMTLKSKRNDASRGNSMRQQTSSHIILEEVGGGLDTVPHFRGGPLPDRTQPLLVAAALPLPFSSVSHSTYLNTLPNKKC